MHGVRAAACRGCSQRVRTPLPGRPRRGRSAAGTCAAIGPARTRPVAGHPPLRERMEPKLAELAKSIADTQTALNIVWTMVAGFLVMFMQAGFALVETGLT